MDIKSKILKEVEEEIGAYAVMTVQDAFEKSQTLKDLILDASDRADSEIDTKAVNQELLNKLQGSQ